MRVVKGGPQLVGKRHQSTLEKCVEKGIKIVILSLNVPFLSYQIVQK